MNCLKASYAFIFAVFFYCQMAIAQFAVVGTSGRGARGGGDPWRIAIHGGLASQEIAGLWGSNFDRLNGSYYGAFVTRAFFGGWHNGLQYVENSGTNVNPFLLSTYQTGQYKLKFSRLQYLTGFASGGFRGYLVAGLERVLWQGAPDLGLVEKSFFQYGLLMSYDLLGSGHIKVPATFGALRHGQRDFEFSKFPDDTVISQPGLEVSLGLGVALDF